MEEDDWLEPTSFLDGTASGSGNTEVSDLLLQMNADAARLRLLLAEADSEEWRTVAARLKALRWAIDSLPTRPARRQALGFK